MRAPLFPIINFDISARSSNNPLLPQTPILLIVGMSGKAPDGNAPPPLLRALLPAHPQSRGPELPQRQFEFKRKRQAAACEPCREHKTKVDPMPSFFLSSSPFRVVPRVPPLARSLASAQPLTQHSATVTDRAVMPASAEGPSANSKPNQRRHTSRP